jgi:hypothetical protein
MGEMIDETEYTSDLTVVSRKMQQMGQNIPMSFSKDKMTLEMQGTKMEVPFSGAYLTDGAGFDTVIAGLPLQKDYQLVFEMPDMTSMKAKLVTLKVTGSEKVNTLDCLKVEIKANDNANDCTTLWINPTSKMAEKMTQIVPAMGNAKMTTTKK